MSAPPPDPQTASTLFFGSVAAAYLAACLGWLAFERLRRPAAGEPFPAGSARPVVDFALALAAVVGILLLGAAYAQGWLLSTQNPRLESTFWILNNLIIYAPIGCVLLARGQGAESVLLSARRLPEKVGLGLGLGGLAVATYFGVRGEAPQIVPSLVAAFAPAKLDDFPAIFLEGVAVAFVYVRLRWLVGAQAALAIPCALFALAHVPSQIEQQRSLAEILAFLAFNTSLTCAILWTVQRSRDVIWIGLVHYLMDVAIQAI